MSRTADTSAKMPVRKFDDIFEYIGGFETFQFVCFALLGAISFLGLEAIWTDFTAYPQDHWCEVSELKHLSYDTQKYIAIPEDWDPKLKKDRYSQCRYYDLNYTDVDHRIWNRSQMITNETQTKRCESWVYDRSIFVRTVVSEVSILNFSPMLHFL